MHRVSSPCTVSYRLYVGIPANITGSTIVFVSVWRCVAPKISDLDEINALSKSTPIVPWYDLYDYYPLTRCLDLRKGKFTRAGKEREYPQSTAKLYGQFVLQIGGWCL